MNVISKITLAGLLALTAIVLVMNVQYLYVAPIPNTWTWWPGDETWLMAEYKHFLLTGHYINPLAPGSVFAQSSGLVFGSCYLTAVLYALPLHLLKGHTIDIGRTITWLFSIMTLIAFWQIAKRYRVGSVVRAFGCLLLSSTVCFFITSHSARSDMLIGMVVLILAGWLPFIAEGQFPRRDVILGLLLPASLLVNGHVLIIAGPMIVYIICVSGILRHRRTLFRCAAAAAGGFGILLLVQWVLLGSTSISGPFTDINATMPFARLLHPRAHLTNYTWRIFIARMWAPGVEWVSVALLGFLLWARFRFHLKYSNFGRQELRFLIAAALAVISSIYIEYYWPRYFIYVLPTIVLTFIILISFLLRNLPRASATALWVTLSFCLGLALWRYDIDTINLGTVGEKITSANEAAVTEALAVIHSHHTGRPRIFATVPGQAVTMDDSCDLLTPVMYDWKSDTTLTRDDVWKRARIDYAIVCNQAQGDDRGEADSSIDWLARSKARLIFERIGPISDIDRPYDRSNLKLLDTLRVYEF